MSWIKRNLYFVIGSVVALALMGLAGWFLYSKWSQNNEIMTSLNTDYEELRRLNSKTPHPGHGQVNNVELAKAQQQQLRDIIKKTHDYFQRIPPIPDEPKVSDRDFSVALSRTIYQLQRDATNASATIPPNYNFSFEAQKPKVSFAAGSLNPLAMQLGEVKAICDVLFQAKINSLDNVRRERVSADDSTGPQSDYLTEKSVTNELAVMTPYEVTFRCFSTELAAVLAGFSSSSNGVVVKTINVEPAPATAPTDQTSPMVVTTFAAPVATPAAPMRENAEAAAAMARRYGLGGGGRGGGRYGGGGGAANMGGVQYRGLQPQATYAAPAPVAPQAGTAPTTAAGKGGLPTVLDEKQLKVTLNLIVVKLLPSK